MSHKLCKKIRKKELKNDLMIPPFLILSITSKCNLECVGCLASNAGNISNNFEKVNNSKAPLNFEDWKKVIKEASEIGVFPFIIAGGEPFLFPNLVDLCLEFKNRTFIIFTNGTVLTKKDYEKLKNSSNIAMIISIEGDSELTNGRRGKGVYKKAMDTIQKLNNIGIPIGISVTITRGNYEYFLNPENIDFLTNKGIKIIFFTEYIPMSPNEINNNKLCLKLKEHENFRNKIKEFRLNKPLFIIHSPGDEEKFGGCVSAGKGFAHITPLGDLTPCPVSNIATHNLKTSSLKEALRSPLFKLIRENENLLETNGSPCALSVHPQEVEALRRSVGAYKTNIK